MLEARDFVTIEKCTVSSTMSLGLFVVVEHRKFFVPFHFLLKNHSNYASGDVVTLDVLRTYAQEEGLAA
jgi:hypothetical protein